MRRAKVNLPAIESATQIEAAIAEGLKRSPRDEGPIWPRCCSCDGPAKPVGEPFFAVTFTVDTRNEANGTTQRWAKINRRSKAREATIEALTLAGGEGRTLPTRGPWYVRITRVSPSRLDDDAVGLATKTIRDTIAAVLKVDDGSPRVAWVYAQQKGKPIAVRVEVWGSG